MTYDARQRVGREWWQAGEAFDSPRAGLPMAWVAKPLPLSLEGPSVVQAIFNDLICGLFCCDQCAAEREKRFAGEEAVC